MDAVFHWRPTFKRGAGRKHTLLLWMERASVHSAMKRLSRLTLKVVALPGGIHGYRTTRDGLRQLAQEMRKRPDSLDHLTAKAEMARRAAVQDRRRSWIMLASAVIAAIAVTASALSAYFSYLQTLPYPVFWLALLMELTVLKGV